MEVLVDSQRRRLCWGQKSMPCAIGRGGARQNKVEGDGATPIGAFPLRRLYCRPDRIEQPVSGLPVQAIAEIDGWCDEPSDKYYNQLVNLPYGASHERLWRRDHLYDLLVVLGHNDDPVVAGNGSAIFFHLAHEDLRPTEGCVAIAKSEFLELLPHCNLGSVIKIY